MASQLDRECTTQSRTSPVTTLLAGGWGLISAYTLFAALLNPHSSLNLKLLTTLAALVPLIAVWAAIERKRWGRLALLGVSANAICLFIATAGYNAAVNSASLGVGAALPQAPRPLPFYDSPLTLGALLVLAASNVLWLRSPGAVAEFEHNKRPALAGAQRLIAAALVVCWSIIMMVSNYLPGSALRAYGLAGPTPAKQQYTSTDDPHNGTAAVTTPPPAF